jgi:hypothetical protein
MKKIIAVSLLITLFAFGSGIKAQTQFSFSGLALDENFSKQVSVSLEIPIEVIDESGSLVYKEMHTVSTNARGQFIISVGEGSHSSGTLPTKEQVASNKYILEYKIGNGSNIFTIETYHYE